MAAQRKSQLDASVDSSKVHASMNNRRPVKGGDVFVRGEQTTPRYNATESSEYSFADHIAKLKADTTLAEPLKGQLVSLFENGFVIIPEFFTEDYVRKLEKGLEPLLENHVTGRNAFEGLTTQRCYALLGKSRAFDDLCMYKKATDICDRLLLPNYLVTAFQAIRILPGEQQQNLHTDDGFIKIPRPHQPFSVAFIYALDDFTETNGATVVVPKSHLWGDDRVPTESELVPVIMKRGSAVVFLSTLWHGGGSNRSDKPRQALTAQYVEPYFRPQENQMLNVPVDEVLKMPKKLQSLIGYSIHVPFVGFSNGEHPLKRIDAETGTITPLAMTRAAKL